ncbi:hypothetical protein B0H16DRAFT_1726885 [Mycena metata]|uniref:Uncharacterized protein n=1 Tax=Mycena metata TaxID=1033252 RepID=A0AAD7IKI5_9AGAR|nr:hypothetical protein B0H16DRAFT_1726885 [Mycena metata]
MCTSRRCPHGALSVLLHYCSLCESHTSSLDVSFALPLSRLSLGTLALLLSQPLSLAGFTLRASLDAHIMPLLRSLALRTSFNVRLARGLSLCAHRTRRVSTCASPLSALSRRCSRSLSLSGCELCASLDVHIIPLLSQPRAAYISQCARRVQASLCALALLLSLPPSLASRRVHHLMYTSRAGLSLRSRAAALAASLSLYGVHFVH